jgi:hypothetical protein
MKQPERAPEPRPVYISDTVPTPTGDALALVRPWTAVCHLRQPFLWICHDNLREVSRWTYAPRKRPFSVTTISRSRVGISHGHTTWHATLDAAIRAAKRLA